MKSAGCLLLAALALQGSPQDEYKSKLLALNKASAAKHYSIGDYLSSAQMFLWAREQFYKAVELDPDNEGARKKLGFKKNDTGQWESDPNAKQEFGNKKKAEEADKIRKQYGDRLDSAGKDLSRQWADLGIRVQRRAVVPRHEIVERVHPDAPDFRDVVPAHTADLDGHKTCLSSRNSSSKRLTSSDCSSFAQWLPSRT